MNEIPFDILLKDTHTLQEGCMQQDTSTQNSEHLGTFRFVFWLVTSDFDVMMLQLTQTAIDSSSSMSEARVAVATQ